MDGMDGMDSKLQVLDCKRGRGLKVFLYLLFFFYVNKLYSPVLSVHKKFMRVE